MTEKFDDSDIEDSDIEDDSDSDSGVNANTKKTKTEEIHCGGSDDESVAGGGSDDGSEVGGGGYENGSEGGSIYGGDADLVDENTQKLLFNGGGDDDDDDDDNDENYLQKFADNIKKDIISDYHPELKSHNYEEVETLCKIVKNENGIIIDPLHKTLPFITKYEKTRILGERAKQLNAGAKSFIEVDNSMIDGYLIALKEYEQKKIPFIIRRPIPDGTCEYWKLKDLEMLD
jgi:DNA-directed RNA polymerase I, II, and III subunit RPABC2